MKAGMTFQGFSARNAARCRDGFKHDPASWSPSDWMVATMGELGEAANVLKKLNRERDGIKGNTTTAVALRDQLRREIADTFIYLDLMSQALGFDLESAVIDTFDAKSREIGYPVLIEADTVKRFWFDTEFIEDGKTIDLLSIGIVAEDGSSFYAENTDADLSRGSEWVQHNVIAHLNWTEHGMGRGRIRDAVLAFVSSKQGKPEFWAYYADYDWVAMCQLFGTMMDLPKGWPMYCRDLKQLAGDTSLPEQGKGEHHALADARWARDAWHYVTKLKAAA